MNIDELIRSLEKEIRETVAAEEQETALLRLQEIAKTYAGDDKVVSSLEIWEKMKEQKDEGGMMSGYGALDDILGGFRPKQLIVLSAPTKNGKTSLGIEFTIRMKQYNPLWFPFEEPAEELLQKFKDRGEEPPLFYVPQTMSGNTLEWIEKKVVEAKAKYDTKLVFIDHLHFIVPPGSDDMNQRIGLTMRTLKKMAVRWGVAIVLIAHLRKTDMTRQPDLEDLRDSSFIAQESDTVIIMWRKTERTRGEVTIGNEVNVSVQANRRTGKTGNVKLTYNNGRFLEVDWSRSDESEAIPDYS